MPGSYGRAADLRFRLDAAGIVHDIVLGLAEASREVVNSRGAPTGLH